MLKLLVSLAVTLVLVTSFVDAESEEEQERPFRHAQTQQLWEKAGRKKLEPSMKSSLFHDLKDYDKRIMKWKKTKHSGLDEDGSLEAELREELKGIMVKYGIISKERAYPDSQYKSKNQKSDNRPKFYHKELDKLWKAAVEEGSFSRDELMQLEVEFHHHKEKLLEYNELKNNVDETKEHHVNEVEGFEHASKKQKLNEMSKEVDEGYERLHLKMGNKRDKSAVPFTEPRVASLWNAAIKSNMSSEELDSIREELKHFQVKIEKHRFFDEKLKHSQSKLDHMENMNDHEQFDSRAEIHRSLENKVEDLSKKITKLHKTLYKKLGSEGVLNHREL